MAQLQLIRTQPISRGLECAACGSKGEATCDCGAPYLPAGVRAAEAIAANPEKSDRAIAADIGVSQPTVSKARKATDNSLSVEPRIGLDGKRRRLPTKAPENEMPTETEADESYQDTLYDQACLFLKRMTDGTRERFLSHIEENYRAKA